MIHDTPTARAIVARLDEAEQRLDALEAGLHIARRAQDTAGQDQIGTALDLAYAAGADLLAWTAARMGDPLVQICHARVSALQQRTAALMIPPQ